MIYHSETINKIRQAKTLEDLHRHLDEFVKEIPYLESIRIDKLSKRPNRNAAIRRYLIEGIQNKRFIPEGFDLEFKSKDKTLNEFRKFQYP